MTQITKNDTDEKICDIKEICHIKKKQYRIKNDTDDKKIIKKEKEK
jgi:hypothetical protein